MVIPTGIGDQARRLELVLVLEREIVEAPEDPLFLRTRGRRSEFT